MRGDKLVGTQLDAIHLIVIALIMFFRACWDGINALEGS